MTDRLDVELLALQAHEKLGVCATIGPAPGVGKLPYFCTLADGHLGAHVSRDLRDGTVYDSWVE